MFHQRPSNTAAYFFFLTETKMQQKNPFRNHLYRLIRLIEKLIPIQEHELYTIIFMKFLRRNQIS